MKKVVVLGSTGSLGVKTLKLLKKYKKDFEVLAITGHKNTKLFAQQIKKYRPKYSALTSKNPESLTKFPALKEADIVINVLSGIAGIKPTLTALKNKKQLLTANKESIVTEGKKIQQLIKKSPHKFPVIPLDSEHNAIFEILQNHPDKKIKKIILPCSGGPLYKKSKAELKKITPEEALKHPKWKMGTKISLESATLINKGLEIIEAHYLFNLPLSKIDAKLHPQCQIHGVVEFEKESSTPLPKSFSTIRLAYFGAPDMSEHIENALLRSIDKTPKRKIRTLQNLAVFQKIDHEKLPGIKITLNAFKKGKIKKFLQKEEKTLKLFLDKKVTFTEIFKNLSF